jgi:hypothetical protein
MWWMYDDHGNGLLEHDKHIWNSSDERWVWILCLKKISVTDIVKNEQNLYKKYHFLFPPEIFKSQIVQNDI